VITSFVVTRLGAVTAAEQAAAVAAPRSRRVVRPGSCPRRRRIIGAAKSGVSVGGLHPPAPGGPVLSGAAGWFRRPARRSHCYHDRAGVRICVQGHVRHYFAPCWIRLRTAASSARLIDSDAAGRLIAPAPGVFRRPRRFAVCAERGTARRHHVGAAGRVADCLVRPFWRSSRLLAPPSIPLGTKKVCPGARPA